MQHTLMRQLHKKTSEHTLFNSGLINRLWLFLTYTAHGPILSEYLSTASTSRWWWWWFQWQQI